MLQLSEVLAGTRGLWLGRFLAWCVCRLVGDIDAVRRAVDSGECCLAQGGVATAEDYELSASRERDRVRIRVRGRKEFT